MYYEKKLTSLIVLYFCSKICFCDDLIVKSTAPAVLKTPVTFTATLDSEYAEWRFFIFEDDTPQHERRQFEGPIFNARTIIVYNFDDVIPDRTYYMTVRVYNSIFGRRGYLVAENYTAFRLSANLIGNISVSEEGLPFSALNHSKIATNETVNMTAAIWDPMNYFANANFYYSWTINEQSFRNVSLLEYNFTIPQVYNISVVIDANVTSGGIMQRFSGKFDRSLEAKAPVKNVVVSGKKAIPRDNDLSLTVQFEGSPPFWYCDLIRSDKNITRNFTCDKRKTIFTPNFHITRYFQANGSYLLLLKIGNDVSTIDRKAVEITIFGINNEPQLSFVIVPVTSCIVAVFIIIAGIGYHLKHKPNYTIEVADFDFQHQDDLVEKTLFERVRESFTASIKGDLLSSCRRGGNYGSYMNDDDVITGGDDGYNSDRGSPTLRSNVNKSENSASE